MSQDAGDTKSETEPETNSSVELEQRIDDTMYEDVPDEEPSSSVQETQAETSEANEAAPSNATEHPSHSIDTSPDSDGEMAVIDDAAVSQTSEPYVGRWNRLISTTNWEKGAIINDWRTALIESGAPSTEYSDEAWSRRVGGVTAPHVGRLRRVHDRFGDDHDSYAGLYWSHFLAALEWSDAPMWLEGAVRSGWSVSQMRRAQWEANGGDAASEPRADQISASDTDEDVVMPAQG
ncbi:MAG: hypothetical protein AAFN70_06960, partial [Planctomycetota bacterium]